MRLSASGPSKDRATRAEPPPTPAAPRGPRRPSPQLWVSLALAAVTLAAFLPACGNEFVEYDDQLYVTANPRVQAGLTGGGVAWALTDTRIAVWHPLAWWSLQLDADLYGLNPAGFHLTSILLHTASVVVLFWALYLMTGAPWPAAAVAAVFAVHPLRVESVAWVAERKDVLATLLGMLALLGYARYARQPGLGRYLLVVAAMAVGLTAKPTLVTLPGVLLLLDYWPLGRLDRGTAWRRVIEKLPLFALAAAGCAVTVAAQQPVIGRAEEFPLGVRVANALTSYVQYLVTFFCPVSLAAFYPHPRLGLLSPQALGAGALLAAITVLAARQARRRPYLLVGWLWYLGTLVPMIGLVQVGGHGAADRYTYIPLVGVTIALVWYLAEQADRSAGWRAALRIAGPAVLALLVIATWRQEGYWHDTISLWYRALDVTTDNHEAHRNLAVEFEKQGKSAEALRHYEEALRTYPIKRVVHNDLGAYWMRRREYRRAEEHFRAALANDPDDPLTRNNLGGLLIVLGKAGEAEPHLRAAVEGRPLDAGARFNLALACVFLSRWDEADGHFTAGGRLSPDNPAAHHTYGVALRDRGRPDRAVPHLEAAAALWSDNPEAHHDLAFALETLGQLPRAIEHYRRAVRLEPRAARYHCGLAHACHAAGDPTSAAGHYRDASRVEPDWPDRVDKRAWRLSVSPDHGQRNGLVAVYLAEQVCQATGYAQAGFVDTLAAAYAEVGRFEEAANLARQAAAKADPELAREIQDRLKLYEARRAIP
jgi:tetratricopeptide (TPR) repeat protein